MIIAGEKSLLQLKKMGLAYLLYIGDMQRHYKITNKDKCEFLTEQLQQTEIFISEIERELKPFSDDRNNCQN